MIYLKFKRIEIRRPKWDPNPEKSTTENHEWRQGLFVIFEDVQGVEYDYMPKWQELEAINSGRSEVESLNRRLCKENMEARKK